MKILGYCEWGPGSHERGPKSCLFYWFPTLWHKIVRNFNTLGSCPKATQPKNSSEFVDPCCPWVNADSSTRQHTHMSTHHRTAVTAQPVRGHFHQSLPTPLHHPLPFVITLVSSGLISWHLWISNCMWNVEIRGRGLGTRGESNLQWKTMKMYLRSTLSHQLLLLVRFIFINPPKLSQMGWCYTRKLGGKTH